MSCQGDLPGVWRATSTAIRRPPCETLANEPLDNFERPGKQASMQTTCSEAARAEHITRGGSPLDGAYYWASVYMERKTLDKASLPTDP